MVLASTGDGQTLNLCATQESRGRFKPRTCDVPCPEHLAHLKEATLGCLESSLFSRGRSLCSCPPPPQYHLSPKANPVLKHLACGKARACVKPGSGVTCFVKCLPRAEQSVGKAPDLRCLVRQKLFPSSWGGRHTCLPGRKARVRLSRRPPVSVPAFCERTQRLCVPI